MFVYSLVEVTRKLLTKIRIINDLYYEVYNDTQGDIIRPFLQMEREDSDLFVWIGRHHFIIEMTTAPRSKLDGLIKRDGRT